MRLHQILKEEFLRDNLLSDNKKDVLAELINILIASGLTLDATKAIDVLQHREKLGSTGIGDGVAIPHGKISDLSNLVIAFGRSKKGIPFNAVDGKPVHLFFLLMAPENSTGQHLKVLAKISKLLKTPGFRKKLIDAKTTGDLYKAIIVQDESCPA